MNDDRSDTEPSNGNVPSRLMVVIGIDVKSLGEYTIHLDGHLNVEDKDMCHRVERWLNYCGFPVLLREDNRPATRERRDPYRDEP